MQCRKGALVTTPISASLAAVLIALTCACNKDDGDGGKTAGKSSAVDSRPAPPQEKVTGAALVKVIEDCTDKLETWDKEGLRDCFSDSAEITYVDNIPPVGADNRDHTIVGAGSFRNAFPDFQADSSAILVNGNKAVEVMRQTGTHKNPSLGIPPTGKRMSMFQVSVRQYDDRGRIAKARYYVDSSTLFHQLGIIESASAAKEEKPWQPPVRAVAKQDDQEKANLELVKHGFEALGKSDVKGAVSMYAPDARFRYVPQAIPSQGTEEIEKALANYVSLSSDFKLTVQDAWAAADWVVVEMTASGKLADDLAGWKGSKGKEWALSSVELLRLAGGKVKEHWSFANGLKFAVDVGLVDPSMLSGE